MTITATAASYKIDDLQVLKPLIPIAYALSIIDLAVSYGVAKADFLREAELDPSLFSQADSRLTRLNFEKVIDTAKRLIDQEDLAFVLGTRAHLSAHGFLGYAILTSQSLADALNVTQRFYQLRAPFILIESAITRVEEEDILAVTLKSRLDFAHNHQFIFCSLTVDLARSAQFLAGDTPLDIEIWLDFPPPASYSAWQNKLPVIKFNQACIQIRIPQKQLNIALPMANVNAHQMAVAQCEKELTTLHALFTEHDIVRITELLVIEWAEKHQAYPVLAMVAERLNMSQRTLKRKLQQQGTRYLYIVNSCKQVHALHLLKTTQLSIDAISSALGYTDVANFCRAYKQWTGHTPSAQRKCSSK